MTKLLISKQLTDRFMLYKYRQTGQWTWVVGCVASTKEYFFSTCSTLSSREYQYWYSTSTRQRELEGSTRYCTSTSTVDSLLTRFHGQKKICSALQVLVQQVRTADIISDTSSLLLSLLVLVQVVLLSADVDPLRNTIFVIIFSNQQ